MFRVFAVFVCCTCTLREIGAQKSTDENAARDWLDQYNQMAQEVYYNSVSAAWNYNTNITDYNQERQLNFTLVEADFDLVAAKNASMFDWSNFTDASIKRQLSKISVIGSAKLAEADKEKYKKLQQLVTDMETIYSTGKVKDENGKLNTLEPDLTRVMADPAASYDKLLWAWKGWRDVTGSPIRPKYKEFVQLSNEAARLNDYTDTGEYWRSSYNVPNYDFQEDLIRLYEQLKPLYEQLHAYVRKKLKEKHGEDKFPKGGHIPAHLLGNMWAQTWSNLLSFVRPYPDKESVDITPTLIEKKFTAKQMFELSDEFFTSLGLLPMPPAFWNHSMIVKPKGREVVCHASAWDFYNGKDFRIKQCTDITMEDLITVHHEMGHIEYYLQYKAQPLNFRRGANPGFHEAVGDVLALSVATPKHLKEVGLLEKVEDDKESDLNFLLSMALDKIAFIPFGYLMDQWRWSVFNGETPDTKYNEKWWDLRCKYQGLAPPVERSEKDFDPGAKYHIPANTPYIRYFVSYVLQFQFHRALCKAANETEALHKCDIYRSKEAGKLLGDMLKLGSSEDWPVALEKITGKRKLDASAIIDYFKPLIDWLKEQNKGEDIGWKDACPTFPYGPINSAAGLSSLLSLTSLLALCTVFLCVRVKLY